MRITTKARHLSNECEDVSSYENGYRIGTKLVLTCLQPNYSNAIGLAHNQIGGNKKVYIVKGAKKWEIYINPSIVAKSEGRYETTEGCMSYPNKPNKVIRHDWVVVRHLTIDGYVEEKFDESNIAVHQHENDHLSGLDIHHQTRS